MNRARLLLLVLSLLLASCGAPVKQVPFTQPSLFPVLYQSLERYQNGEDWQCEAQGRVITVPKGLIVDGASVPRVVWIFMPPDGLHRAAALGHDWIYILQGRMGDYTLTRLQADHFFYDYMRKAGVGKWRAGIAYRAVRAGGWHAWDSKEDPIILPVLRKTTTPRRGIFNHIYATPHISP